MDNQEVISKTGKITTTHTLSIEEDISHKEDTAQNEIKQDAQEDEKKQQEALENKSEECAKKEESQQIETRQEEEKKVMNETHEEKHEEAVVHEIKPTEEKVEEVVIQKEEEKEVQHAEEIVTEVKLPEVPEKKEEEISHEEKKAENPLPEISPEVKLPESGVESKLPEHVHVSESKEHEQQHHPEQSKGLETVEIKDGTVEPSPVKAHPQRRVISSEKKIEMESKTGAVNEFSNVPNSFSPEVKKELHKSPEQIPQETKKLPDPLQLPDRIDIEHDKDNETLKQVRKNNEIPPEGDSMQRPRKGFCTKCTIF